MNYQNTLYLKNIYILPIDVRIAIFISIDRILSILCASAQMKSLVKSSGNAECYRPARVNKITVTQALQLAQYPAIDFSKNRFNFLANHKQTIKSDA